MRWLKVYEHGTFYSIERGHGRVTGDERSQCLLVVTVLTYYKRQELDAACVKAMALSSYSVCPHISRAKLWLE